MKNDPMVAVVIGAATLKRMVPAEFDLFLRALQGVSSAADASLRAAPSDGILQAQGRAQVLEQLVKKLDDCIVLTEQYNTRR